MEAGRLAPLITIFDGTNGSLSNNFYEFSVTSAAEYVWSIMHVDLQEIYCGQ